MDPTLARYHRQMLLPGFGEDGQQRLRRATAALLGCGALGSVAADLLARAGVGHLVIIDRDFVELSNLQRQVLFDERDVAEGIPKAEAARRKLAGINSQVRITAVVDDINHGNIERLTQGADVLVDGLDNFETRYLANDVAVKHGMPYGVHGAPARRRQPQLGTRREFRHSVPALPVRGSAAAGHEPDLRHGRRHQFGGRHHRQFSGGGDSEDTDR